MQKVLIQREIDTVEPATPSPFVSNHHSSNTIPTWIWEWDGSEEIVRFGIKFNQEDEVFFELADNKWSLPEEGGRPGLNSTWTWTPTEPLPDGSHTLYVRQQDLAEIGVIGESTRLQ